MTTKEETSKQASLLWRRWEKGFGEVDLQNMLGVFEENDFIVDEILCKGTPRPDIFEGTLRIKPESLDHATNVLRRMPDCRLDRLEVFPFGIINPEWFVTKFRMTPGG